MMILIYAGLFSSLDGILIGRQLLPIDLVSHNFSYNALTYVPKQCQMNKINKMILFGPRLCLAYPIILLTFLFRSEHYSGIR